jgi:Fur family ferric uptake transcriptional regulator
MSFVEQASAAIRAAGGRFTPQRRLIIELLEQTEAHLSAERLYEQAQQRDASISPATVYRTLHVLQTAGLIDGRFTSRHHTQIEYEPVHAGEHYHFVCRRCHRVLEFETEWVQEIRRRLEDRFQVIVDHACVCFEGLCAQCQNEEEG